MIPAYHCPPPKQSCQQIMPGKEELQQDQALLQAIASDLTLNTAALTILNKPETMMQRCLQRRLKRLAIAHRKISEAAEILRSLSA